MNQTPFYIEHLSVIRSVGCSISPQAYMEAVNNGYQNTCLGYLYISPAGSEEVGYAILQGVFTPDDIINIVHSLKDKHFDPDQVQLDRLEFSYSLGENEEDDPWHRLHSISLTNEPGSGTTVADMVARFKQAAVAGWAC